MLVIELMLLFFLNLKLKILIKMVEEQYEILVILIKILI